MRRRHREETYWYGNFRNQEPDSLVQGWETYDARPRFGVNLFGMRGRLGVLSEGYSNNVFPARIKATYDFVREVLSLVAEKGSEIRRLAALSATARPDSIAVRSTLAPARPDIVVAEITHAAGDGSGGFAHRTRSGVFKSIRMPVFDRFVAIRKEARPAAYLLPPHLSPIAELLRRQGVRVERLAAPWRGPAETFMVDTVTSAATLFEGHHAAAVEGRWDNGRATDAPAGWLLVRTDQPLGTLAAYLLEPASEDGFVNWNFLDRDLRPHGEYPMLRTRAPVRVPTTDLP
jgi:hypothetical protein